MPQTLRRNLSVAKIRAFFGMFLIIVPILVPYWQSLGLTIQESINLQVIFAVCVAIFEIPTGYIADIWGRKASLIIGGFISACAFTWLPFAKSYEELILFEIIVSLGSALSSGSDIAIVYDSLTNESERSKTVGILSHLSLVGEAVASILSGLLVIKSFESVVWAQCLVMWIPFICSFFFIEPPIERMASGKHIGNIKAVFSHIFLESSFTCLVFANLICWSLSSFCIVWLLQPYWELQGINIVCFGWLWAGLMLISAFTSKYAYIFEKKFGTRISLLLLALCPCFAYIIMSSDFMGLGVLAGILFYINRGLTASLLVNAFNQQIKSSFRATANSISSLSFRLGFGVIGPGIAASTKSYGLLPTLAGLCVVFSILFILLLLPLAKQFQNRSN